MSEDTNKKWLKDVDSLSLKNRAGIVYGKSWRDPFSRLPFGKPFHN